MLLSYGYLIHKYDCEIHQIHYIRIVNFLRLMYIAEINIMPLKELLDPQGKAVEHGLKNMSFDGMSNVRVGKHITLKVEAGDETAAKEKVEVACKKLLVNPVIESYEYTLHQEA